MIATNRVLVSYEFFFAIGTERDVIDIGTSFMQQVNLNDYFY